MTTRTLATIAAAMLLGLNAPPCQAKVGAGANAVLRDLGIGWSDGFHAHEGCPDERVGRRKHPSRRYGGNGYGYGHHDYSGYGAPAGYPGYAPVAPRPARHPTWIPFDPDYGMTAPPQPAAPVFSDPSGPTGGHHPSGPLLPSAQARPTMLR